MVGFPYLNAIAASVLTPDQLDAWRAYNEDVASMGPLSRAMLLEAWLMEHSKQVTFDPETLQVSGIGPASAAVALDEEDPQALPPPRRGPSRRAKPALDGDENGDL